MKKVGLENWTAKEILFIPEAIFLSNDSDIVIASKVYVFLALMYWEKQWDYTTDYSLYPEGHIGPVYTAVYNKTISFSINKITMTLLTTSVGSIILMKKAI